MSTLATFCSRPSAFCSFILIIFDPVVQGWGGGGVGVDANPREVFQKLEKRIYSVILKLSVSLYSSLAEILICQPRIHGCHGNAIQIVFYIFLYFLQIFHMHFGMIFQKKW